MITHKSFKHGWFYHYRIHEPKTELLCNHTFSPLKDYLHRVVDDCPQDYFESGPRGSRLRMPVDVDLRRIKGHEICELARLGLETDRFRTAHTNVQMFMLQHDNKTISVEVPVWMLHDELPHYHELLGTDEALTGHIDALRVEDAHVWVWDYKPAAALEKYAATQVQFYSLMLSRRTGIPLENFRCGYFDENLAFVFKPQISPILKSKLI